MQTRSPDDYKALFGFDKKNQLALILLQVLWILWLASAGFPHPLMLLVFLVGTLVIYAFCHVIYSTTSRFTKKQKKNYLVIFSLITLFLLALTNWLTWAFAAGGLVLAALYYRFRTSPFLKKALFGLGSAWFVPLIFTAINHRIPHISWVLYFTVNFWIITAAFFRSIDESYPDQLLHAAILQAITFILLMGSGIIYGQGLFFFIALLIVLIIFLFQLWSVAKNGHEELDWICTSYSWIALLIFLATLINYHY